MTTLASTSAAAIRLTAGCAAAAVATSSPSTTAFFTTTPAARAFGAEPARIRVDDSLSGLIDAPTEDVGRKVRRRRIVAGDEEEAIQRGTVSAAVELRFSRVAAPSPADVFHPAAPGTSSPSLDTLSSPTPPSARSARFAASSRRLGSQGDLQATVGYLRARSAALSSHARPLSTVRTLQKPALDTHGDARPPPHFAYTDSRTVIPSDDRHRPAEPHLAKEGGQPDSSTAAPAEKASSSPRPPASADSVKAIDKPSQRPKPPPRPPSPYGEINELVRHPLLYDPVLKPRFPIVLCHGTHLLLLKEIGR